MELGKRIREIQTQDPKTMLVRHTQTHHWIPRPYLFQSHHGGDNLGEEMERAWAELTWAVTDPGILEFFSDLPGLITKKKGGWGVNEDHYPGFSGSEVRVVKKAVYEAINKFDDMVRRALEWAYSVGFIEGSDLLVHLNMGEISPGEVDSEVSAKKRNAELMLRPLEIRKF